MYKYLIYFLAFSFFGWCAEVVYCSMKDGRLVNRGLARGPICPIYGVGMCLSVLLLGSVKNFFLLALLSMAVATLVEFALGYLSHKILGSRLWDYTDEKGNILGYVCPRFSLIWGFVCASVIKLLPFVEPIINRLDAPPFYAVSFILLVISIVDIKTSMSVERNKNSA